LHLRAQLVELGRPFADGIGRWHRQPAGGERRFGALLVIHHRVERRPIVALQQVEIPAIQPQHLRAQPPPAAKPDHVTGRPRASAAKRTYSNTRSPRHLPSVTFSAIDTTISSGYASTIDCNPVVSMAR